MRLSLPQSALIAALVCALPAAADVIRLKNGRTIVADSVREVNGRVEYEIGEDTYAIPRSSVEAIQAGGVRVPSAPREEVPTIAPVEPAHQVMDLTAQVVREGKVDPDALASIARSGNAELGAAAYYSAGRFEHVRGNPRTAAGYMQQALALSPDNALILEHYASVLLQTARAADALPFAERAARMLPNSADAHLVLGFAYYATDKTRLAVEAWKRSLQLRPSPEVEQAVARAERELAAEAGYGQQESIHFTMRYEGKQAAPALRREILATLEMHYADLTREFGAAPRESVAVVLYPEEAYFDVTRAPQWTSAVNDGKLRIPLRGVQQMTADFSRVLRHELAHSFINQISRRRCPLWLHEGIAQLVEGRSVAPRGRLLARAFATGRYIPLNGLEGSFLQFTEAEAVLAYDEALAVVEYIHETYGMSDLQRVLQRIGEGASTEAALRATVHSGYSQLEQELAAYLRSRYGD